MEHIHVSYSHDKAEQQRLADLLTDPKELQQASSGEDGTTPLRKSEDRPQKGTVPA